MLTWRRQCLPIVIAALLAFTGESGRAEDRALVIGINRYPQITLKGVAGARDLAGAVTDARSFERYLAEHVGLEPKQILTLTDEQATRERILAEFGRWLVDGTSPGDRAFFFFAGHGAQTDDIDGDEARDDLYDEALAPFDAAGELTASPVVLDRLILDDELGVLVAKLEGRQVELVIDSCHSGTITRGAAEAPESDAEIRTRTLTPRSPATSRGIAIVRNESRQQHKVATLLFDRFEVPKGSLAVWTATASAQEALDLPTGGLFTQTFLKAVVEKAADGDGDGVVSVTEALAYVQAESEKECRRMPQICLAGLTPTLEADAAYFQTRLAPAARPGTVATSAEAEPLPADAFFAHKGDFGLTAAVQPGTSLKLGDVVRFEVEASVDAQLILLDEGPDGAITQLYPNRFHRDSDGGKLAAGRKLSLPDPYYGFRFTATVPGRSRLIAMAVEKGSNLDDVLAGEGDFKPVKDGGAYLASLAKALLQPVVTTSDSEPNRRRRWAHAVVEYDVAE